MAREAHRKVEPAFKLYTQEPKDAKKGPEIGSYESVADLLRRTREQYGEDLRSVAEALRIRHVHLLAIEEGRFRDLPGSTYALGFVRSYAEFLGLDGPEIVERFKEEVAELNRKTQLVFPTPVPEGKVPGGALILISVVLLGAAYGAWTYLSQPGATIADLIPPVPEHLQSLSGEKAALQEDSGQDLAAGAVDEAAASPTVAAPPETTAGEGQMAAVPPLDDGAQDTADQPAPDAAAAIEMSAPDDAVTASEEGDETAVDQAAAEPVVDEPMPPADEAPVESAGEAAAAAATETVGALAEGPGATAAVEPTPFPASPEGATRAGDANAAEQAVALPSAERLDGSADASIPAAPQLASRVPGREPQVYGADNVDARIVLRAHHDSWVQVRDAQDSLLLTRVLREGDEYRVPNRSGLTLLTGNAGGIEILVDGRRLPPLGPLGSVRRDIALDPEQLAQGRSATE